MVSPASGAEAACRHMFGGNAGVSGLEGGSRARAAESGDRRDSRLVRKMRETPRTRCVCFTRRLFVRFIASRGPRAAQAVLARLADRLFVMVKGRGLWWLGGPFLEHPEDRAACSQGAVDIFRGFLWGSSVLAFLGVFASEADGSDLDVGVGHTLELSIGVGVVTEQTRRLDRTRGL